MNDKYSIVLQADNGKDFIEKVNKIKKSDMPDIVLLDINMPIMDGFETAEWVKKNFSKIKVIVLGMYDDHKSIIRMIKLGACGYLLKDTTPKELYVAIDTVFEKGYFFSEVINKTLYLEFKKDSNSSYSKQIQAEGDRTTLTDREAELLKLVCTELTYREIAEKMKVSPRTIDAFRDSLFEKLNVKTRVGLAMFAVRNNLIDLNE
jgi:DNA-binding NarL/FixJ family response regulator